MNEEQRPEGVGVGWNARLGDLMPMEQLIAFADWEAAHNPEKGTHVAKWALDEIYHLHDETAQLRRDKARLDWLETQACWIGLGGDYEVRPINCAGRIYQDSVRAVCDRNIPPNARIEPPLRREEKQKSEQKPDGVNVGLEPIVRSVTMTMEEDAKRSLELGARYPYDGGDWWHDESSTPPPASDWAHAAARGVLCDLSDRRGIKSELEQVDADVREELTKKMAAIIRAAAPNALDKPPSTPHTGTR